MVDGPMASARPLRLLMTADAIGGVWQYATELAAGLADHGCETLLAVLGPPASAAQRDEAHGVPGLRLIETGLPLDWLSAPEAAAAAAVELARLARSERVDLVHLNSPALAAAADFGVPVLGVAHGCLATWWDAARPDQPLDPAFAWHRDMMARGLRACDRIVAPSAGYAQTVTRLYHLPAAPHVVHNGRSRLGSAPARPIEDCAFTAGRLWDEVKNARVLDAVAARLAVPFHGAGSATAPHGETLALAHLHCLGHLDAEALADRLAARPVFVAAATFEPFGLAVLEAAASGCALVLSDIPVFRELWDGAAIFVDPSDVVGFAAAIEGCIADPSRRTALGEAARQRAGDFSAQRMAAATAGLYRELLAAHEGTGRAAP